MNSKAFTICALIFLFALFLEDAAFASDENHNNIFIDITNVDYDSNIVTANIKVSIIQNSGEGLTYLLLPFGSNPDIMFFIEPNSTSNTILSGYLNNYGDFIVQIPLLPQKAYYYFTFFNVHFSLHTTSDNDSSGYYRIALNESHTFLANQYDNLVQFGTLRINDKNVSYTQPNAIRENDRSLVFNFPEMPCEIFVFLMNPSDNINILLPIIAGVAAILLSFLASFSLLGIDSIMKTIKKYKAFFRILSVVPVVASIIFFWIFRENYGDTVFITAICTIFGISTCISIIIFSNTRNSSK